MQELTLACARKIAAALGESGGDMAMRMRLASDLITQYGNLAKSSTTMIVPAEMGDLSRFLATAMRIADKTASDDSSPPTRTTR